MNTNIYSTMHANKPNQAWRVIPFATAVIIGLLVLQVTPKALALRTATEFGAVPPATGKTMELSVYSARYDGGTMAYGGKYEHFKSMICASNNPAHKLKTLIVTYGGRSVELVCRDTGGDKRLGYSRLDISGAAMRILAPKWSGKDRGAPLLRGAKVVSK